MTETARQAADRLSGLLARNDWRTASRAHIEGARNALEAAAAALAAKDAELGRRTTERNYHMRVADQLAARIRELDAELAAVTERRDSLAGSVAKYAAELAEMREAIRPFAKKACVWNGEPDDLCVQLQAYDGPAPSLNVAHFRDAYAALTAGQGE